VAHVLARYDQKYCLYTTKEWEELHFLSGYKMFCLSLMKLDIILIQLILQIRLYKFLKYVFLYLFSLNLGGREPYFKREMHQHQ